MKERDAASKRVSFADRVRELLEKVGLTQTQLADQAEIAPAGLSRILSSDRPPTMAHVLAMAPVLKVTAAELVGGTSAQDVLAEWVPKEHYEESERAKLDAINRLEVVQADVNSRDAEIAALRTQTVALREANSRQETDLAKQRGELELGRRNGELLKQSLSERALLQASNERLSAQVSLYEAKLKECHSNLTNATRLYEDAHSRVADVQQQLIAAKNNTAGATAIAALLGGIFGAAMATPSTARRRRS